MFNGYIKVKSETPNFILTNVPFAKFKKKNHLYLLNVAVS